MKSVDEEKKLLPSWFTCGKHSFKESYLEWPLYLDAS